MRIDTLRQRLRALGAKPKHEHRVLRLWSQALPQDAGKRRLEDFMPQTLRDALPALADELQALARLKSEHPGEDGSSRLLVELGDGQTVESVLLPRDGLCVSTQVGCAVGCVFCMTGQGGLVRQVSSGEIVAQVALARACGRSRRWCSWAWASPRTTWTTCLRPSTCWARRATSATRTWCSPPWATRACLPSCRAAPSSRRWRCRCTPRAPTCVRQLLPRAPRMTPDELVEAGERYARATGYPIQYQWTLLEGINDTADELAGIVRLLKGKYAVMNMIPYNSVPELDFKRPSWERAAEIARTLHRAGVLTKLRHSAGQDVDGGCGQLRARAEKPARRVIPLAVNAA
jgi:23S rRNA (adenine2503-C2)-methyltransferase